MWLSKLRLHRTDLNRTTWDVRKLFHNQLPQTIFVGSIVLYLGLQTGSLRHLGVQTSGAILGFDWCQRTANAHEYDAWLGVRQWHGRIMKTNILKIWWSPHLGSSLRKPINIINSIVLHLVCNRNRWVIDPPDETLFAKNHRGRTLWRRSCRSSTDFQRVQPFHEDSAKDPNKNRTKEIRAQNGWRFAAPWKTSCDVHFHQLETPKTCNPVA